VLYYNAAAGTTTYLKDKGAALGMVRNKEYGRLVETRELTYQPGDIMFLYTDGITEAKDAKGEEFGYERLTNALKEVTTRSAEEIEKHVIDKLYEFSGTRDINDDYTSMTIKFNESAEQ
jgi:serine phosphatase RsbU (regulator of sigma subunit)